MPVVGKRYRRFKNNSIIYICQTCEIDGEIYFRLVYKLDPSRNLIFSQFKIRNGDFWDRFEELPDSNWQKPEEVCPIETAEAAWNMSEEEPTKGEVSEVERALEELKQIYNSLPAQYGSYSKAVQNIINALEAEKRKGTTNQENKYFQAGWVAAREMFRKPNYATLTDFINSFEQMQKDIEELKRK